LNLKADEVVLTKQDYPNMINAWKQREKRDGIKLVWLNLTLPEENEDVLVKQYVSAFTSRTKVVHVTHLINWSGQILPVKKIAQEAHKRGIEVIADGAHTLAHFNFNIPDLECDYFASSLHKWLSAPFGSGLLYIRKEKIKNVWALLSNNEPDGPDIRKFDPEDTVVCFRNGHWGCRRFFHDGAKKENRYVSKSGVNQKDLPGFHLTAVSTIIRAIASLVVEKNRRYWTNYL
jgi:selenocysteine lyase/cysteine desulfurase